MTALDELLFDKRREPVYIIIGHVRPFGRRLVDSLAQLGRLHEPLFRRTALDERRLIVRQPVYLILPLGVTPFVSGFGQRRIPDRVQIRRLAEEGNRNRIAATVAAVARVHRAVHVPYQMDQHLQRFGLFLGGKLLAFEFGDQVVHGRHHIAGRLFGHRVVGIPFVDVGIVPCSRIGVLGRVAGGIQPIGVIDRRMTVQYPVDLLRRFGRQVAFGDVSRHIVSLLSPSQGSLQRAGAEDE